MTKEVRLPPPSPDLVALLSYDPATGVFTWARARGSVHAGDVAGTPNAGGYMQVQLGGRRYMLHRLAWFIHYGEWPVAYLDHINRNPSDNRIANLRPADSRLNQANRIAYGKFKKGVSLTKVGTFKAAISDHGRFKHLGTFQTEIEAAAAYAEAAKEIYGEFARC